MNDIFWTSYFGAKANSKTFNRISLMLACTIVLPGIPGFFIEIINELLVDFWNDFLIPNIFIVLIITGIILFLELKGNAQEVRVYRGRKTNGKNRYGKAVITGYIASLLVGYSISVICIELTPLQNLTDHFFDKQMSDDGFFKSLGYNYLHLLFYYIEHLIYLILIPVLQLILVNTVKKTRKNLLSR